MQQGPFFSFISTLFPTVIIAKNDEARTLLLITFSFSFPVVSAQQWFLINSKDLFLSIVEFSDLLSTVHFISFQLNVKDELPYSACNFPLNH